MQELKEKLPVLIDAPGARILSKGALGGMVISYLEVSAGTDLTPLLEGLPNDKCPCPHWGYMLKGSVHLRYVNGKEEIAEAGQVFYLPPGHTAWFEEDATLIEFSPEGEYREVISHITSKTG